MSMYINHIEEKGISFITFLPQVSGVTRVRLTAHLPRYAEAPYLLPNFLGDMLTRGSLHYSKEKFEERIEFLGAQITFHGESGYMHAEIVSRDETLSAVLNIFLDTLQHPLFATREIGHEKKEYLQALHEARDNARSISYALFTQHLYKVADRGYIPSLEMQEKGLAAISQKVLKVAHAKMRAAHWTVSIAASPASQKLVERVVKKLHLDAPHTPHESDKGDLASAAKTYYFVPEKQNVEFFIGNRLPLTLTDDAYSAFAFGLDVLGKRGGFAGRLMSTVREKEGLTYSIYAWMVGVTALSQGHWQIMTFFTAKDSVRGIASTVREIKKICAGGITQTELLRFKELLKNQFRLAHESTSSMLALYHGALVSGRTPRDIEAYPKKIDMLTRREVNQALRTYMQPDALVITGAGPTQEL